MKKIFENWRRLIEASSEKNYSDPDELMSLEPTEEPISSEEPSDATMSTEPGQKKAVTGTIKTACNCVDGSESSLSVQSVKKIINDYYKGQIFGKEEINNTCDKKTQNAIMQFQADTGIKQDGCVGDETETAMVKVGILKALTRRRRNSSSTSIVPSSADLDVKSSSASSFAPGATISIKADTSRGAKKPHWSVPPNFHGYGRDTATDKNYKNDAFLVNGKDFNALLKGKPGIATRGTAIDQFGHPLLATIIAAAAAFAVEFDKKWAEQTNTSPKTGGNAELGQVSLGGRSPCQNRNIGITAKGAPCIQGGWTRSLGSHRYGHQSGLEADIGFYTNDNSRGWFNARTNRFKKFDFVRNCAFTEALLSNSGDPNDMIELVLLGPSVINSMRNWIRKNNLQDTFPNIMQTGGKLRKSAKAKEGKNGHDNHYHIRAKFPADAPNVSDYKRMIKVKLSGATTLPEEKSKYSFVLGTVGGDIIAASKNSQSKRFYGASIQKPIAALLQMVQYKNDPDKKLNDKELRMLLSYSQTYRGSNEVNRSISKSFSGGRKSYKERSLGKIDPQLASEKVLNSIFGITNKSFVYSDNRQTAYDYYKFLSGMARMKSGNYKNELEKNFAESYKQEIDKIFKYTDYIPSNIKKSFNQLGIRNFWGKGGRALGALNYGIVIDNKYVLVVYTRFGSGGDIGSEGHKRTGPGGVDTNKMLSIVRYLVSKMR